MARRKKQLKKPAQRVIVWTQGPQPSRDTSRSPDLGTMATTILTQKPSKGTHVGRLRWACLRCREDPTGPGYPGLDVKRKSCPRCGPGDHVKKIRV